MNWSPKTTNNGWFPKLSPNGTHIIFGFWATYVCDLTSANPVEKQIFAPNGRARLNPLGWLDDKTFIAVTEAEDGPAAVYSINLDTLELTDLNVQGYAGTSFGNAANGSWGIFLQDGHHPFCIKNGQPFHPELNQYGCVVNGENLLTSDKDKDYEIMHFIGDTLSRRVPSDNRYTVNKEGDILTGYYGPVKCYPYTGGYVDATITPWRREEPGCSIRLDGDLWIWNAADEYESGIIMGRRLGEKDPIVLKDFPSVQTVAVWSGTEFIVAGNSDKGILQVRNVSKDAPRTKLIEETIPVPTPNVRPFPRKLWVSAYFSYSLRPGMGDTDDPLGNAQTLVGTEDNGEMISAEVEKYQSLAQPLFVSSNRGTPTQNLNLTVAWLASSTGKSIDTLDEPVAKALNLPEKPVIAYLDSREWPDVKPHWVNDRVWPAVMCYRNIGESAAQFLDIITDLCNKVQNYGRPFFIVLRMDDSAGNFTEAQALELMPIYEHLIREFNVVGILLFSDRRGNGMAKLPTLRAWGKAFTNAAERPSRYDYWGSNTIDPDFILKEKLKQSTPNIVLTQSEKQKLLKLLGDNSNPVPIPPIPPTPIPVDIEFIKNYILTSPHIYLLGKGNSDEERKINAYTFVKENVTDLRSKGYDVGLLFKDTGNNVNKRSVDILCIRFGPTTVIHYDVIVANEAPHAHVTWEEVGPIDHNRFRED